MLSFVPINLHRCWPREWKQNTQEKGWLCKILGVKQSALWGVFHSTKLTSGLNFRQLPVANGTTLSKISKKEDSARQVYPNFRKCFPEVFFPFNFSPGISRIFPWVVRISQIQQFLKPRGEISVPFGAVFKFSKVLVEWRAPVQPHGLGEWPEPETRCQVPKLLEGVLTVTDQFPLKKNLVPVLAIRRRPNGHMLTGDNTTLVTTIFYSRYVSWRYCSELTGTSSWSSWTSVYIVANRLP